MASDFLRSLREHWPEAVIEGASLAIFMLSAIGFTILLEHPASPLRAALPSDLLRRFLMGCAMGATLIGLVYNRFGQRSGAHFNPALTLTYYRLGKITRADGLLYGAAHFSGAALGVLLLSVALPTFASDPHVRHAATLPGSHGVPGAFAGEVLIAFTQMSIVLGISNSRRWHAWTGIFAALGVALYISFEAPFSGMSMNPARTLGSALGEQNYASLWLYFLAPVIGMFLAAEVYVRRAGLARVYCAKFNHAGSGPCLFRCDYPALIRDEWDRVG